MPLTSGTRLGPYEILSALGAGGMGEVYRARDSKLGRDVAIKVVLESFTYDPERAARFHREAQLLAALNHPHIATIHGLEEAAPSTGAGGAVQFLVMELVDGESLAERLTRGPLPIGDALAIAKQIADALQAAHEKGIVHRDLKPANVALTAGGQVKVLDFGLAKTLDPAAGSGADAAAVVTHSPTLSLAATHAGVILGTAAYMAPEQARGKPADKRADIWAFGCVLYEMLTGTRVFDGEDLAVTLAAALMREPDWSLLPRDTPPAIQSLLRRCLQKDRGKRLADITGALVLIEESSMMAPSAPSEHRSAERERSRWRMALAGLAAALAASTAAGAAVWWMARPAPPRVVRSELTTSGANAISFGGADRSIAIAPDGSRIVYRGAGRSLLVRALDQLQPSVLSGVGTPARNLFVSPDGEWIGFFDGITEMKKVAMAGGPSVTITSGDGTGPRGATWGGDGTIVYATNSASTGLLSVPAAGGESSVLTRPNREAGEADHLWPEFLPDSRAVLFTIVPATGGMETAQIAVLDRTTGAHKVLIRGGHHAHYVPTGHLVYGAGNTLRAVLFDAARLEVLGTPVPIVEGMHAGGMGYVNAVIAANGTLLYVPDTAGGVGRGRGVVWVGRDGREEPIPLPPRFYFTVRVSPDGTRVAADIRDQDNDTWVWDFARRTLTRLTFAQGADAFPIWTPDGRRVVYARENAVMSRAADGTGAEELLARNAGFPMSFSPDGKQLIVTQAGDVGVVASDGSADIRLLVRTPAAEGHGELSPDGRWLAYQSTESGELQVYVQPFPDVGAGRWQISPNGGSKPAWARSGRELFYLDATSALMSVAIETGRGFSAGTPTKLFDASRYVSAENARSYDVAPDGRRFLFIESEPVTAAGGTAAAPNLVLVQNWFEELKRLVPVN